MSSIDEWDAETRPSRVEQVGRLLDAVAVAQLKHHVLPRRHRLFLSAAALRHAHVDARCQARGPALPHRRFAPTPELTITGPTLGGVQTPHSNRSTS